MCFIIWPSNLLANVNEINLKYNSTPFHRGGNWGGSGGWGRGKSYPLEAGVARVPGDDRDAQVVRQLGEVLRRRRLPAVRLRVAQEQDGRHVAAQEVLAEDVQDGCKTRDVDVKLQQSSF